MYGIPETDKIKLKKIQSQGEKISQRAKYKLYIRFRHRHCSFDELRF